MSKCTHTTRTPDKYVELEDYWTGEKYHEWQYGEEVSAYEDLDLHRIKCTLCGHINYYSGAARQYFENGIKSPGIRGLE